MCGVDLTRAALGQPVRSTMREPGVNFSGLKFLSRYRHREHIYDLRLRETGKLAMSGGKRLEIHS